MATAESAEINTKLVLKIGEFIVTPGGVHARIRPPLEEFSSYYSWRALPFGLGAMKTLVESEDGNVLGRLVERLGLSSRAMYMLNLEHGNPDRGSGFIGDSDVQCISPIADDLGRLLNWSFTIADQCPYQDVADVLRSLPRMDTRSMDRYVETFLG